MSLRAPQIDIPAEVWVKSVESVKSCPSSTCPNGDVVVSFIVTALHHVNLHILFGFFPCHEMPCALSIPAPLAPRLPLSIFSLSLCSRKLEVSKFREWNALDFEEECLEKIER